MRFLDYLASISIGLVSVVAVILLVPPAWGMFAAMLAGMAAGMLAMWIIALPASIFLGPFEVMMPGMFTSMFAGMVAGMWISMGEPSSMGLAILGLATGLGFQLFFHIYDLSLHGEVAPWEEDSAL
ncbi:MAG: hypothetical protein OEZ04_07650 [Nitrospinota bacterium]|nr:hypothetical protein [Nitrospinota bacterium]